MCTKANVLVQVIRSKLLSLDDVGPLCRGNSLSSRVEGLQVGPNSLVALLVGVKVEDVGFVVRLL